MNDISNRKYDSNLNRNILFFLGSISPMQSKGPERMTIARTSPKSKHIHKFDQLKHSLKAYRIRGCQIKEEDIYHESSEQKSLKDYQLKNENEQALQATLKIESYSQESLSEWKEEMNLNSPPVSMIPCGGEIIGKQSIITARRFNRVKQLDFELYCTFLLRTKIYGALLIDHRGRLLWCDKTVHQLLEGSLNNFERIHITELLLNCQLPTFLQELKSIEVFDQHTILHWLVYSKNSKRRYKKIPFPKRPSSAEIFYRFLKALTVRIRPISIDLPNYRDPNGFCNQSLFAKGLPMNCFFVEMRLTKRPPDLSTIDFNHDPIIKKFIKKTRFDQTNRQKSERADNEGKSQEKIYSLNDELNTINEAQERHEAMDVEKQRQRREFAVEKGQKIQKQQQKSEKTSLAIVSSL